MKSTTSAKQLNELLKQGWSEVEAKEILAERIQYEIVDSLRKRIVQLDALDTTRYGDMKDSAHFNALDTCSDNGLDRDPDSIPYMESYVATLSMLIDEAGIAH
jgi:hypothetical protein